MNKARYPMGKYKIKRNYKRKYKHNLFFKGRLTKYQVGRRVNGAIFTAIILIIIMAGYTVNFYAHRSFSIINDQVVPEKSEAAKYVESTRAVLVDNLANTSPVETPEQEIRRIAREMSFKWPDYLVRLAKCESSLNPQAININRNGTADKGIFQINDVHNLSDEFRYDIRQATIWTINKINAGQQRIWMCDKILKNKLRI